VNKTNIVANSIFEYLNEQNEILLAPNGNKSNLPKTLYEYVRTNEFKNWFGDWENKPNSSSKVVDENGEPLVVYHGTPFNFDSFKISDKIKHDWGIREYGVYFTDSIVTAKEYSLERPEENTEYVEWNDKLDKLKMKQDWEGWEILYLYGKDIFKPNPAPMIRKSGRIIEGFLNIRNPFIKDAKGKHWFTAFKNVIDNSLSNGNDGVICSNVTEVYNDIQNTYIVFNDNQIKKIRNGGKILWK